MKRGITPERARQLDKLASQILTQFPTDMVEVAYLMEVLVSVQERWEHDDKNSTVLTAAPVVQSPRLRLVE